MFLKKPGINEDVKTSTFFNKKNVKKINAITKIDFVIILFFSMFSFLPTWAAHAAHNPEFLFFILIAIGQKPRTLVRKFFQNLQTTLVSSDKMAQG
jgi:hypothetical protein